MQQLSPELYRCLWIGIAVALHSFFTTLLSAGFRSLTHAHISRFHLFHPRTASRLDYIKKHPEKTASTLSVLRVAGITAGALWILPLCSHIDFPTLTVYAIIAASVFIIIGDLLPQALGNRFTEAICFIFVHPFTLIAILITPVTIPLSALGKLISRTRPYSPEQLISDLTLLTRTATTENVLSPQQAHLIQRSIELSDITAADIMVKSTDIKAIPDTMTLSEALIEAHLHHHTRFPLVHDSDFDQIIGYINFKDIVGALQLNPAEPSLNGIKRPLESVLMSAPLPELLQVLTRGFQHMVIVTNETGSTMGIVTLEDLMETLVGDLEDEYDNPPEFIVQLGQDRFCAGGGTSFSLIRQKICADIPDWDLTIAEWITGLTKGNVPDQYSHTYERCTFTVRKIARGKVFDVTIDRPPQNK